MKSSQAVLAIRQAELNPATIAAIQDKENYPKLLAELIFPLSFHLQGSADFCWFHSMSALTGGTPDLQILRKALASMPTLQADAPPVKGSHWDLDAVLQKERGKEAHDLIARISALLPMHSVYSQDHCLLYLVASLSLSSCITSDHS